MMRGLSSMVCVAVLGVGCGSEEAPGGEGAAATGLPCETQDVLERNCQGCHAAEPRYGAPMPLVTADDLMAPAASDPSMSVFEMVSLRIHDGDRPMPPTGLMEPGDLRAVDDFITGGLPRNETACVPGAGGGPSLVGTEHLPCEPSATFLAFGDGGTDAPYALAPDAGNLIQCFVFDSPWGDGAQGTAFAPIVDDDRVLHHWILFGSESLTAPAGTSFDCSESMPTDAQFITGWAPGGQNNVLPDDIGMDLPVPGSKLLLQVHYWNVAGHDNVRDRSGVAVCTGTGRPNTARVHALGTLNIAIPPRTTEWSTSGRCTPAITEPVTVMSAAPHMHQRGRSLESVVLRGGAEASPETMVRVDNWDFNTQTSYPAPMMILPGDVIETTCTYDNPGDSMVYFGERTEDEMCFNFVLAYPAGALVNEGGRERGACIDARTR
jgi:hypothetical protein